MLEGMERIFTARTSGDFLRGSLVTGWFALFVDYSLSSLPVCAACSESR